MGVKVVKFLTIYIARKYWYDAMYELKGNKDQFGDAIPFSETRFNVVNIACSGPCKLSIDILKGTAYVSKRLLSRTSLALISLRL